MRAGKKKDKLPEIVCMENRYFSLEIRDDNRLTKIFRIIFGLLCGAIAIFWVFYNFTLVKADGTQWITLAFLVSFGLFQIYAGFGFAAKFIVFTAKNIRLKKNSLFPAIDLPADQIEKIEMFPLKIHFFISNGKKILLRFGISDPGKIELIKDEIVKFADSNSLILEFQNEEI
ncbi:MAG: hypothetical protein C0408_05075 [Odoribacter sp.]|nr:hypothetical protein [Odoribacter sp.]